MGALDFLFNGQAPAQTTQYGQSQTNVPTWLQEYSQGLIASANALAAQPYQTYGGPRVAPFTPSQTQAQSEVQGLQGQYQSPLSTAMGMIPNASNPSAINQGLGYLPSAQGYIGNAVDPSQASINPYEQDVIQQAETQAQQQWQNFLQPSIENQFAAAGQAGSSADERAQMEQANQVTQNIQNTAQAALAGGFQNAQQTNLAAGQATGALGQIAGGLGYEGGVLGLQGANQLGSLAQTQQGLGLQGAAALDTTGAEQQNLQQQNLGLAYQDYLTQQQYPYQQAGWLSQMLTGTATPTTVPGLSTSAGTGYAPSYAASPLSQTMGLYNMLGSPFARGGRVVGYRRGGSPLDCAMR